MQNVINVLPENTIIVHSNNLPPSMDYIYVIEHLDDLSIFASMFNYNGKTHFKVCVVYECLYGNLSDTTFDLYNKATISTGIVLYAISHQEQSLVTFNEEQLSKVKIDLIGDDCYIRAFIGKDEANPPMVFENVTIASPGNFKNVFKLLKETGIFELNIVNDESDELK